MSCSLLSFSSFYYILIRIIKRWFYVKNKNQPIKVGYATNSLRGISVQMYLSFIVSVW